jgi:hypothetical protein
VGSKIYQIKDTHLSPSAGPQYKIFFFMRTPRSSDTLQYISHVKNNVSLDTTAAINLKVIGKTTLNCLVPNFWQHTVNSYGFLSSLK